MDGDHFSLAEKESFEQQFLAFEQELRAFVYRLVANRQDMEDLVQETYLKSLNGLEGFEGRSSIKTWVFSIGMNLSKNHLTAQKRWTDDFQDNCRTATLSSRKIQQEMGEIIMTSPQGIFELKEHIDYCFTCMAKTLSIDEQVCLILKEVYAFKVKEIIEITGLTEGQVKYALTASRNQMIEIFDRKCSLVSKNGACHQCTELSGMLNPKVNALEEQNKLQMVREKGQSDKQHLFDLRLKLVQAIDPIEGQGFELHNYMIESLPDHSNS